MTKSDVIWGQVRIQWIKKGHWEYEDEDIKVTVRDAGIGYGAEITAKDSGITFRDTSITPSMALDKAAAQIVRAHYKEKKTYKMRLLGSKDSVEIQANDGQCPYCAAAITFTKFTNPGEVVFVCNGEGEEKVREVKYMGKQFGVCMLVCEEIEAKKARQLIARYARN